MNELLQSIMGGGRRQQETQDFVNRYDQGPPWAGISDQEAMSHYQQVAGRIPPDMYEQSAQEAFARLTPQQRQEFYQHLQQQARQQNLNFPDLDGDGRDDR